MWRTKRGIIVLLLAAFVVRIFLLWYATGLREHPDILRWKDWGRIAFLYGYADTYEPTHLSFGTYPNNMPPGTLYIVSGAYWAWLQAGKVLAVFGIAPGSSAWVNVVLLRIFITVPSLLCDIFIGWFIWDIVRRFGGKDVRPLFAASLYLFNPAVLFNSSIWGQMDSVNNVFFVFSLWFLLQKRFVMSAVAFASSLLVKFSLAFAAPYWLLVAWAQSGKKKNAVWGSIGAALFFVFVCILPISRTPHLWFPQYVFQHGTGEMTNVTAFAYNAWWSVFRPELVFTVSDEITKVVDIHLRNAPLTQTMYGPISLGSIAIVISLLSMLPVYMNYVRHMKTKKPFTAHDIVTGFAVLSILAFLFLPQMHERYLYPAFALLAMLIGFGSPLFWEFIFLSFINGVNLVAVWHPMPLPVWVFEVLRNQSIQWTISLITVSVGLWTAWKLIRRKGSI